jgi:hypothetical protein
VKIFLAIPNHSIYYWRVKAKNISGWGEFSDVRIFRVEYTGVSDEQGVPKDYTLSQNFPNPFNPTTQIKFGVPGAGHVTLEVFSMLGDRVAVLLNENLDAGYHYVNFNGSQLASGVYFYRLATANTTLLKKMILVK